MTLPFVSSSAHSLVSTLPNKSLTVTNVINDTFYNNDPERISTTYKLANEVFGEN